jgi:hypothetical protein
MVRPVADPANRRGQPVALFGDCTSRAVADGDDRVKITHLLAAVASAGVDFLAPRLAQPSNRPVPRGTGAPAPGAVPHYRSARGKALREASPCCLPPWPRVLRSGGTFATAAQPATRCSRHQLRSIWHPPL